MALLDKDALLAALDRAEIATADVNVPELGGALRVREMPGTLRNRLEAAYATVRTGGNSKSLDAVTAQMIATCVIDESGRPMMTVDQAKRLMSVRPKVAFRLRDSIVEVSAVDEDDVEALAEVFDDAQSDSSTSA